MACEVLLFSSSLASAYFLGSLSSLVVPLGPLTVSISLPLPPIPPKATAQGPAFLHLLLPQWSLPDIPSTGKGSGAQNSQTPGSTLRHCPSLVVVEPKKEKEAEGQSLSQERTGAG